MMSISMGSTSCNIVAVICISIKIYNHTLAVVVKLRWVQTCNVTAYRNTVTFQVTDMIRNYKLNFHPVPHGVTISCERCTVGFPVCYGSPSDVFAASSGFVRLYILGLKEKEKSAALVTCHEARPDLLRS